jgi:hypothetical protein
MILFVESGDLVSGQIISTSALALAASARWRFRQPPPSIEAARLLQVSTEAPEQSFPLRLQWAECGWAAEWIANILARETIVITPEAKDHLWCVDLPSDAGRLG